MSRQTHALSELSMRNSVVGEKAISLLLMLVTSRYLKAVDMDPQCKEVRWGNPVPRVTIAGNALKAYVLELDTTQAGIDMFKDMFVHAQYFEYLPVMPLLHLPTASSAPIANASNISVNCRMPVPSVAATKLASVLCTLATLNFCSNPHLELQHNEASPRPLRHHAVPVHSLL